MNKETINKIAEELAAHANLRHSGAEHPLYPTFTPEDFAEILNRYIPDVPDETRFAVSNEGIELAACEAAMKIDATRYPGGIETTEAARIIADELENVFGAQRYRASLAEPSDEPRKHGVIYATVRDAINSDDEEELHIECRFANGGKYAPIVIDAGHDELAHAIAEFLSAPKTAEPSDETPLRKVARERIAKYEVACGCSVSLDRVSGGAARSFCRERCRKLVDALLLDYADATAARLTADVEPSRSVENRLTQPVVQEKE